MEDDQLRRRLGDINRRNAGAQRWLGLGRGSLEQVHLVLLGELIGDLVEVGRYAGCDMPRTAEPGRRHPAVVHMKEDLAAPTDDQRPGVYDSFEIGIRELVKDRRAADRHQDGRLVADDYLRWIVLHRNGSRRQFLDGEEALQPVEGDPGRGRGQELADVGVVALAMIGHRGKVDLKQAIVEERHHTASAVHQRMGAGTDCAENLLPAAGGLDGNRCAELQEAAVPAVDLRLVYGERTPRDINLPRPGIR